MNPLETTAELFARIAALRWVIRWCPDCGRDNRHGSMGGSYHWTDGRRCTGQPIALEVAPVGSSPRETTS